MNSQIPFTFSPVPNSIKSTRRLIRPNFNSGSEIAHAKEIRGYFMNWMGAMPPRTQGS
jgi:hypothetical protein